MAARVKQQESLTAARILATWQIASGINQQLHGEGAVEAGILSPDESCGSTSIVFSLRPRYSPRASRELLLLQCPLHSHLSRLQRVLPASAERAICARSLQLSCVLCLLRRRHAISRLER